MNRYSNFDYLYKRDMLDSKLQADMKTSLIGDTEDWGNIYINIDYLRKEGMRVMCHSLKQANLFSVRRGMFSINAKKTVLKLGAVFRSLM